MLDGYIGQVYDIGDACPGNVIGVESLVWADYGWGDGPGFTGDEDTQEDDATLLHFGRTANGWKYYLGGKSYTDWGTVVRRFGPVRVTHIEEAGDGE